MIRQSPQPKNAETLNIGRQSEEEYILDKDIDFEDSENKSEELEIKT
jgi:hypothetical protein